MLLSSLSVIESEALLTIYSISTVVFLATRWQHIHSYEQFSLNCPDQFNLLLLAVEQTHEATFVSVAVEK